MAHRERRARCAAVLVCAMVAGCWGMRVGADWDHHARFADLGTWRWMPAPSEEPAPTPLDQAIQTSVQTQLAGLGYEQLQGDAEPDFWVAYHMASEDKLNAETIYRGDSKVPYSGVYPTEEVVPEYDSGTLLIDVIRAQPRELIWRGWARSALRGGRSADTERLGRATSRIFERFPPRTGGAP